MGKFDNYFSSYDTTPPPVLPDDYIRKEDVEDNEDYTFPSKEELFENTYDNNPIYEGVDISRIFSNTPLKTNRPVNLYIQFFMNKGLTEAQARGIYGNIMQESSLKTGAKSSDGYNSYGLAQWTGDRKKALFNRYGTNPTTEQQLEFIWEELNTTEKRALQKLKEATTVEQATKSFMTYYERPNKNYARLDNRIKYALS